MASSSTIINAFGTTVDRLTYHKTPTSINNTAVGSFSLLPLRPHSTSRKLISSSSVRVRGPVFSVTSSQENTMTSIEKSGIKITKNPPESKLADLGVRSWPKWGCDPSKFPWTYSSKETCFLLKGKVKVYPDGSDEAVEIGAGDLVEFPKGMSCTWDVSETVDKHYKFD